MQHQEPGTSRYDFWTQFGKMMRAVFVGVAVLIALWMLVVAIFVIGWALHPSPMNP